MRLKQRIQDRKWLLAALALFWILVCAVKRQLFMSAVTTVPVILFCCCSFLVTLLLRGMSEKDFLLIACFLGVFFIVIAPFACIIDERYHFARSFLLSGGSFFHQSVNGTTGFLLPDGFDIYAHPAGWNPSNVSELRDIWFSSAENLAFVPYSRSASYLPLDYVFSALGMAFARLLRLPLVFVVLFGRLFNYAAYVAVSYFAIRKARYYKSLFFLVAVLPSCLYAGAVISIDACLLSFCLLYVSTALNYCLDDDLFEITPGDMAVLLVSATFILSTKYFGYFPMLLLILFAAGKRLKRYRQTLIGLGAVTAVMAVWQIYMVRIAPGSIDEGAAFEGVSLAGQLEWIFAHKGKFLQQLGHQMILEAPQQIYAYSYSEEPAFAALSLPLRFIPFLAAAWSEDKYPMELKQRRGLNLYWILSAFVMMAMCYIGLYLAWTPVGAPAVEGMQFRYATPYMIFILLAVSTIQTVNTVRDRERITAFLMVLQLVNMLTGTVLHWG
ncbi:MAG: DUF2142 domain-containing protein [Clostridia bacterium]|nr:DUF2142 domain-containing protein [Clostridia bacterium]